MKIHATLARFGAEIAMFIAPGRLRGHSERRKRHPARLRDPAELLLPRRMRLRVGRKGRAWWEELVGRSWRKGRPCWAGFAGDVCGVDVGSPCERPCDGGVGTALRGGRFLCGLCCFCRARWPRCGVWFYALEAAGCGRLHGMPALVGETCRCRRRFVPPCDALRLATPSALRHPLPCDALRLAAPSALRRPPPCGNSYSAASAPCNARFPPNLSILLPGSFPFLFYCFHR